MTEITDPAHHMWDAQLNPSAADKRWRRAHAPDLLRAHGITSFYSHNDNAHIVIASPIGPIDFWPSNCRWRWRDGIDDRDLSRLLHLARPTSNS